MTLFDFPKHIILIKPYFDYLYLTMLSVPEVSVTVLKSMEQWWNGIDGGKFDVLGEQPVRVQLGPPQRMIWNRIWASALRQRRQTAQSHGAALISYVFLGSLT